MNTKSITIGPEKFTVFNSDVSDSESEADEWVSVSTSTTISTTSTLPSHLNLNPRSAIKTRPQPPTVEIPPFRGLKTSSISAPSRSSTNVSPPPPSLPQAKTTTICMEPPGPPANTIQPSTTLEAPITILKRFIPTLTAIYIVTPASICPPTFIIHEPTAPNTYTSFSTLTNLRPNPPISTKATRPNANLSETYLRVCADCAKPPMTIYCDGMWTSSNIKSGSSPFFSSALSTRKEPCQAHLRAFPSNLNSTTITANRTGDQTLICGKCTQMVNIISCLDCARQRDQILFQAVMDAVSPFRRVETQKLGVNVFDMSVPVNGEVYRHVEGCACEL